jgi:DNA-binding transcriptional MerR regulator
MNAFQQNRFTHALQYFESGPDVIYSIETAADLTGIPRRTILHYCRHHLISPVADPNRQGYYFDGSAIRTLRQIEFLHSVHGINLAGTRMILELVDKVERLQAWVEDSTL